MNVRRLPAEQRKEQILACSIDVLAKSNYQKMRVADVADLVGVSEAAIYKYYPTKKQLFLAVLKYMSDNLIYKLTSVIEHEDDIINALHKAASAFADPDVNPPDHVRIRSKAIAEVDDPEIASLLQQEHLRFVLVLHNMVKKGEQQGIFRSDLNIESIVLLLDAVGMFVETLKLLSLEGKTPEKTGLGLMNRVIELIRA
ncbi:MAG TPA: TetR/AcrR family transcriptional regulator [Dehalococcoidia bacterium]|nr:TetR/AcrR family transcriptional regulator [Dehalococcoidia bacterium]